MSTATPTQGALPLTPPAGAPAATPPAATPPAVAPAAPAGTPATPPATTVEPPKAGENVLGDGAKATSVTAQPLSLKLPEGMKPEDMPSFGKFQALAGELGMKAEDAQKLVDFSVTEEKAALAAQTKFRAERGSKWMEEAKADKEMGGQKWNESVQLIRKAADAVLPADFRKELNDMGYGNHPGLMKLLYNIGTKLSPDTLKGTTIVGPSRSQTTEKSLAESVYTHPTSAGLFKKPGE